MSVIILKRKQVVSLFFLFCFSSFFLFIPRIFSAPPNDASRKQVPEYVSGEVLVKFQEGVNPREVLAGSGIPVTSLERIYPIIPAIKKFKEGSALEKRAGWYSFLGKKYKETSDIPDEDIFKAAYKEMPETQKALYRSYKVEFSGTVKVEEAVTRLKRDPRVEYAEPNNLARINYTPTDPLYSQQWAHQKTGAESAWDMTKGDPSVVVAVIDTGVYYQHPDLAGNIWHDGSGNPGCDFVDIATAAYTSSGFTLQPGEDYTGVDNDPADHYGHGTHVAGIIAAAEGNGAGVVGVAPRCRIMPVRAGFTIIYFDGSNYETVGLFEMDDSANAIVYAADNGARVINMSFGGAYSETLQGAVEYAISKNVIMVAAAGNSGGNIISYPAAYDGVIGVGATDSDDTRASFSSYGKWVDVAAPGVDIISTVPLVGPMGDLSGYLAASGTSMASPYVAGLTALVVSAHPLFTVSEVKKAVYGGCKDLTKVAANDGWDVWFGYGRVNLYDSLRSTATFWLNRFETPADGDYVQGNFTVKGTVISSSSAYSYSVWIGGGLNQQYTQQGVTLVKGGAEQVVEGDLARVDVTGLKDGVYHLNWFPADTIVPQQTTFILDRTVHPGWPQDVYASTYTSPVAGDIDHDGKEEFVSNSSLGIVYVWRADGAPVEGWPQYMNHQGVTLESDSPALADLDRDGNLEIICGSWNSGSHNLYVWRYDGTPYEGWPRMVGGTNGWIARTPVAADIDHDGKYEIVFGAQDSKLHVMRADGNELTGWPVSVQSQGVHTILVGDIDGDGADEIVTSADSDPSTLIYAWHGDATPVAGWPKNTNPVQGPTRLTIWAGALADLNGDGAREVICYGTGIYVYDGAGAALPGWPKEFLDTYHSRIYFFAPTVGDLNNDGRPEIVAASGDGKIYAWDVSGALVPGWPITPGVKAPTYMDGTCTLADIDGDGMLEVIFVEQDASWQEKMYAYNHDGTPCTGWPKSNVWINGCPVIGDPDQDGKVNIAAFGKRVGNSYDNSLFLWDLAGAYHPAGMAWPMKAHDARNTGNYCRPGNHPPVIERVADQTVIAGGTLQFTPIAIDRDYDNLNFSITGRPALTGAVVSDAQAGRVIWHPGAGDVGTHNVRMMVSDGDLADYADFTITVEAAPDVVSGFTGAGLFTSSNSALKKIHDVVPSLLAANSNGVIVAGFTGAGLFAYSGGVWIKIHDL
ncbi:MAG: S8 family serine peptidase, partial [Candidatus Omnitrophota bacterium]